MTGDGRFKAICIDNKERMCHIRGKMRKKVNKTNKIETDDIVLLGLRAYQDDKADVIMKYTKAEADLLKSYKQLPENFQKKKTWTKLWKSIANMTASLSSKT